MDNEQQRYMVSSTPHIRDKITTSEIMLDVLLALAPAAIIGCFYFGLRALALLFISVFSSVAFEYIWQKTRKQRITVSDLSAAVTGLLLGMNLPASAPLWLPVVGSLFAIILVKQLFGGIGQNFINPALAARAFLLASYPAVMTNWSVFPFKADAVSAATPLAMLKDGYGSLVSSSSMLDALVGRIGGTIGETCAIALILGGVYLLLRKVITWHIPAAYIATAALLTWVLGRDGFFTGKPHYELLLGGLILGAFFMATDYSTSPITAKGKLIMGVGCGILTVVIRIYSKSYPEGVSYSILLMNLCVPLIDRFTRPRVFGEAVKK